jgi:hypothetical protein
MPTEMRSNVSPPHARKESTRSKLRPTSRPRLLPSRHLSHSSPNPRIGRLQPRLLRPITSASSLGQTKPALPDLAAPAATKQNPASGSDSRSRRPGPPPAWIGRQLWLLLDAYSDRGARAAALLSARYARFRPRRQAATACRRGYSDPSVEWRPICSPGRMATLRRGPR